jgi:hypothetical protein
MENFEYALREENNRLLFNMMLSECRENEDYIRASSSRDLTVFLNIPIV